MLNIQKQPVLVFGDALLAWMPYLDTSTESCQSGRKSAGGASTSSNYPKRGTKGECFQCVTVNIFYHHHLHLLCRLVHFEKC